ncbi:hypothetical protein [Microbispora sp. H10836]|uniref:hypothetical protein n=1 Tax=Microbispora sp. H10836 TaxID=2729106 RepID=UPI0014757BD3|nr:hypothetical protein [Microbispora sp. H10836]
MRIDNRYLSRFLPDVTAAADGSFAFTDTPPQAVKTIYRLTWAGDDGSLKVRAQHQVLVGEGR